MRKKTFAYILLQYIIFFLFCKDGKRKRIRAKKEFAPFFDEGANFDMVF